MTFQAALSKLTFVVATLVSSATQAACNNPQNWFESPGADVKVLRGYQQVLYPFAGSSISGLSEVAYPPPLPLDAKEKTLGDEENYFVSYYELTSTEKWRVCRVERWVRPEFVHRPESARVRDSSRQAALAQIEKVRALFLVEAFLYDSKGRIEQRLPILVNEEAAEIFEPDCYRYGEADYVQLWVKARVTNKCPAGDPDNRDDWNRFQFAFIKGKAWSTYAERHLGREDGTWAATIYFRERPASDDYVSGKASVDSVRGVFEILGGVHVGLLDQSFGPSIPYTDGGAKPVEYYFEVPVPVDILQDIEHRLYDYPRRRETDATSGVKLIEFFPAHQHTLRERFYTGPDGRTLRQEQLDSGGKVKRVINLAFVNIPRSEGGFYDEDLGHGQVSLALKSHKLLYRVWDYDTSGKAKLVALGWNKRFGSALLDNETLDQSTVVYGTPDGKEKWKSKEAFFKAFDFDEFAKRAYP